jgi:hypothetical protein
MAADTDESDTPLSDQAPGESFGGTQQLGDLGDGQQPFHLRCW